MKSNKSDGEWVNDLYIIIYIFELFIIFNYDNKDTLVRFGR